MSSVSRRQFLRGDPSGQRVVIRPPWARGEAEFTASCNRCGDCLCACPEGVLQMHRDPFPYVEFGGGECTFCGACRSECRQGAFEPAQREAAWSVKAVIGTTCLTRRGVVCRSCGEQCAAGAIRFTPGAGGVSQPQLDAGLCSGCGACFAPCPVTAIQLHAASHNLSAQEASV